MRNQVHHRDEDLCGRLVGLLQDLDSHRGRTSRIVLKSDGEILCLKPSEIDWVESAGNYVCFHVGAVTHIFRETMNEAEQRLQGHNFHRIHRSAIVNFDRIKKLTPSLYGDYAVELRDGTKLTMSRSFKQTVLKKIEEQ